jgi:hypothetical protein
MIITINHAGRRLTVRVPKGTDSVSFEEPPPNSGGSKGQDNEKPLIILTDRT